ncbi:hypothetical protein HK097_000743 [Rhizophlyctis rosea]|uniref:F-box domain-containing protein n=1 Tax=Rhizophlyctis rosea TaxID=64517 RepID=A0AAD5SHZ9_9FUNG|nr:hypothetical protein HK097_000743 [Rhizophlyctis rosea]
MGASFSSHAILNGQKSQSPTSARSPHNTLRITIGAKPPEFLSLVLAAAFQLDIRSFHDSSAQALSNTCLLALIFSHTPVESVLNCEQACHLWKNVSRNDTSQVCLPKLIRAFPEGCAPKLYGKENWRDVAVLWYAWRRVGAVSPARIDVTELEEHEAFPLHHDGSKHQLTFVASHNSDITGVSLSGEVIYRTNYRSSPLHQWNVLSVPNRSIAVPSQQICTFVQAPKPYPEQFIKLAANVPSKLTADEAGLKIFGKVYDTYWHSYNRTSDETNGDTTIFADKESTPFQQPTNSLLAFNENVAAYFKKEIGDDGDMWRLHVLRLRDQISLDRMVQIEGPFSHNPKIEKLLVTRFNILYFYGETCDVLDFQLRCCATLELPNLMTGAEVSGDGRFIVVHCTGYRLMLIDVLKREKIVLINGEGRDGWFFGVLEYAVDEKGNRTGKLWDVKVYFRTINILSDK